MEYFVFLCTSFFQLQAYVMQVVLLEKMHIFFFFSVISHQWKLVEILSDFVAISLHTFLFYHINSRKIVHTLTRDNYSHSNIDMY